MLRAREAVARRAEVVPHLLGGEQPSVPLSILAQNKHRIGLALVGGEQPSAGQPVHRADSHDRLVSRLLGGEKPLADETCCAVKLVAEHIVSRFRGGEQPSVQSQEAQVSHACGAVSDRC